jgi:hypothetical protein
MRDLRLQDDRLAAQQIEPALQERKIGRKLNPSGFPHESSRDADSRISGF